MMAPRRSAKEPARLTPRLYLVTPPLGYSASFAVKLAAALEASDVAAVLVRLAAADAATLIDRVRALAPAAQDRGVALLVDGHPGIVAPAGADGAHLDGIAALNAALPGLKPDRIAGCGGLDTRHDAMTAAERGTDYVMFGRPDPGGRRPDFGAVADRVAWWAELFEVPCVGWAETFDEVEALAAAGADFVAIGDLVWDHPDGPGVTLAAAAARLNRREPVS
jgi:thiamine-phosphate pyrophosphorylase